MLIILEAEDIIKLMLVCKRERENIDELNSTYIYLLLFLLNQHQPCCGSIGHNQNFKRPITSIDNI